MQTRPLPFLLFLACASLLAGAEGKWTPDQILKLDPAWLKQQGLELPPARLKDLLSGVISTGGCSGAFISSNGLFLTNHHCLFGIVQEHSTTANDLITNGFLAASPGAELRSKSARITIPHGFTNVTAEVRRAMPASASDLDRHRAIERKQKELVAACEEQPGHRCRVASFDGGVDYVLVDALEVSDVRLVYAPPRAVGEYGGEIDNFAWPRHTGDFAIGRAYAKDGQPYRNSFYFPLSKRGVQPGDFVMVLGYPGMTYRSLTAAEMAERRDLYFARRVDLYGEWIRLLEQSTDGNPAGAIAVAANLKSLNNSYKNAQGQLEGFRRGNLLEKQRAAEAEVVKWAEARPQHRTALDARRELEKMVEEMRAIWDRDFLLAMIPNGAKALYWATTLVRIAEERRKPDAERDPAYQDRELPRLRDRLEREQKNFFAPVDKALFASWLRRSGRPGAESLDTLYSATKVLDPAERNRMFDETPDRLRARRDPLLDLAFALDREREESKLRQDTWSGRIARLRPAWRAAVAAHAAKPIAPDANSTLRVSFAHVKGYQPRDAVTYAPQTTATGMLEKYTGKEPFDIPADVLAAVRARNFGPWIDARLGDLPIDFLADADTSGGNSGSPTVNGRGELVGANFDRVWENVANDFGYNPAIARNVNADVRYLLWMLDRVRHARWLLAELGVQ